MSRRRRPRPTPAQARGDVLRGDADAHRAELAGWPRRSTGSGRRRARSAGTARPPSPRVAGPTPAGMRRPVRRRRSARSARGSARADRRVDLDVLERDAGRQVRRLEAVDERAALEGDAAADRVDARVGRGDGGPASPGRGRPVAGPPGRPMPRDRARRHRPSLAVRRGERRRRGTSREPAGTASTARAGACDDVTATRPSQG